MNGAEALLGEGDMLYKPLGTSKLQRVQGAFISEAETAQIVMACRRQAEPSFEEGGSRRPPRARTRIARRRRRSRARGCDPAGLPAPHTAVSPLQRRLRVGYTRAGRLIDMLERRGIVSGDQGSKARKVLITDADLHRILGEASPRPAQLPEDVTT